RKTLAILYDCAPAAVATLRKRIASVLRMVQIIASPNFRLAEPCCGRLRCAGIAPKSNLSLAIIDRNQKFREDSVSDSSIGHVSELDIEIAEVRAGELDSGV